MNKQELYYKAALVDEKYKKERQFFFIEELFVGDYKNKAPEMLRKKLDKESIEYLETTMKCVFAIPTRARIIFKNYKQFRNRLEEGKIKIEEYFFNS